MTNEITTTGVNILKALDKTMHKVEKQYKGETVMVPSPNMRLNRNTPADVFQQLALMIQPQDEARVLAIIKAGTFEATKCLQALNAPLVAADLKLKPKTWDDARQMKTASLATIKKYKGEDKVVGLLVVMITQFCQKFGRKNDLTENLILELAHEIVGTYHALTVADIKYIFSSIVRESKVFNLDYFTMMQLFEEHYEDRMHSAMQRAVREHEALTANEKTTRSRSELVADGSDMKAIKEYLTAKKD